MASRKGVGSGRIAAQTQDSAPKSRSSQGETVFETDANAVGGRPSRVRLAVLRVRVASAPKGSLSSLQSVSPPKASKLIGSLFQATSPAERLVPSWAPNPIDSRDSGDTNTPSRDPETEAPFLSSPPSKGAPSQSGLVSAGPLRRGDFLAAVGSPFGALSPGHFANSVSVGVVSNWWHAVQNRAPILLADMRCLPGMEGGPVVDGGGGVVGLLWRPLRQRNSGAEVQVNALVR